MGASRSSRRDSNPWPLPYQGSALPAELREPDYSCARGDRPPPSESSASVHTPTGNRTPVFALRTRRPRPLDDGGLSFSSTCGGNRTPNRRFWRPVLYQLSYGPTSPRARERTPARSSCRGWLTGIEPATPGATDRCSNRLSYSHHGGGPPPRLLSRPSRRDREC